MPAGKQGCVHSASQGTGDFRTGRGFGTPGTGAGTPLPSITRTLPGSWEAAGTSRTKSPSSSRHGGHLRERKERARGYPPSRRFRGAPRPAAPGRRGEPLTPAVPRRPGSSGVLTVCRRPSSLGGSVAPQSRCRCPRGPHAIPVPASPGVLAVPVSPGLPHSIPVPTRPVCSGVPVPATPVCSAVPALPVPPSPGRSGVPVRPSSGARQPPDPAAHPGRMVPAQCR